MKNKITAKTLFNIGFFLFICLFLTSCASFVKNTKENPSSETIFEINLLDPLVEDEKIYLEILDDVTGITLNPSRYELQAKDDFSYFVKIPILNYSIVKYRYLKKSNGISIEHSASGELIQYRSHLITHPSIINDKVISWSEKIPKTPAGDISGFIFDEVTGLPIPEIFVSINGLSAISSSDGYFEIKDVPVGEYSLLAYHHEGNYQPFQQGAIIAENSVTPASFGMKASKMVEITFEVNVPENTPEVAALRIIGNIASLGNVFHELEDGSTIIPSRAPLMKFLGDKKYSITLKMASGTDLRYKYTLGDGFTNSEVSDDGKLFTRQLVIPTNNKKITDTVVSWSSINNQQPRTFMITTPENTPDRDSVSIQFNPYTWMQPIPMWKTGENQWMFPLFGPFEYMDNSQFRFCRNDQCGFADDIKTAGANSSGFILNIDEMNTISYTIDEWVGLEPVDYEIQKETVMVNNEGFVKGIAIDPAYDPKWLPYLDWGFISAAVSGSNTIAFSPSFFITNGQDPFLTFQADKNPLNEDILQYYYYAQEAGVEFILFPQLLFKEGSADAYWSSAPRTYNWWNKWFSQYERFVINYARFAENNHIDSMIIGGNSVYPALPGGMLPDGNPSNTPYNFEEKWSALIDSVQSNYSGKIIMALPAGEIDQTKYNFLNTIDSILVDFYKPISENNFGLIFDSDVYPLYAAFKKPIIIGISTGSVDLIEQAETYNSALSAVSERAWINGVISQGYKPSVIVKDASSSIFGKPAMDVLSYYFNQVILN